MGTPTTAHPQVLMNQTHVGILRRNIDPNNSWFTDAELRTIVHVSSGNLHRAVLRALIGLQFRARQKGDSKTAVWSLNALKLHEGGLLELK